MKSELDRLMKENDVAGIWVTGPGQHNPAMVYLTGGGHLTQADAIKPQGKELLLCHSSMEREEAMRTGLKTLNYNIYPLKDRLIAAVGDRLQAQALLYKQIFEDLGLTTGKVLVYGLVEAGIFHSLLKSVQALLPGLSFEGDVEENVISQATATKGPEEIERIRQMGKIVVTVVSRVADFLTGHKVMDEVLVKSDGSPLTIGDVKANINLWLSELGAENPEGTIFAIGRDGGIPHSTGTASDLLRLGQTIVFDIFPCEKGGGYFYDFTRTWCLGYAPQETQALYDQVKSVYEQVVSQLETNRNPSIYQDLVCELFEEMGHATVKSNPATETGYVHGLAHGVGLNIHEKPWSSRKDDPNNLLVPGSVFTIEPGLYYPDQGMGVRLEDTYYVTPEGQFERFVDYPMELVLPMKNERG